MDEDVRLRAALGEVMGGAPGIATADRLCSACVDLLGVDGAAISVTHDGSTRGTFGSSSGLSRQLDEFQFTFGEGPCLDAVRDARPVLVADLDADEGGRWPAFSAAVLNAGVRAVYALPVAIATVIVGALDLYRYEPGPLSRTALLGSFRAAELAALPLLDLMTGEVDWEDAGEGGDGWQRLASLERVEVYQATGMIMGQLDVGAGEAVVRLRAYAYAHGLTASQVAWNVIERRLTFDRDDRRGGGS